MEGKNNLRIQAKNLRKNLQMGIISEQLVSLVRQNEVYKNSHNVMLYYPTCYEVNLTSLFKDDKNFYLPKVSGQNLLVCPFKHGDKLEKSSMGIYEPVSEPINPEILDLVIVPALMADRHGYRLGYGGGYYDRFLTQIPKVKKIVAVPKELFIDELPHDYYDVQIENIIIY